MKTYKIAVIGGDGTGPEVIREGVKVLKTLEQKTGFRCEFQDYDFGGERYLRTGEVLPGSAVCSARSTSCCRAIRAATASGT